MTVLHTPDVRQPAGRSARPVRIGPATPAAPSGRAVRAGRQRRRQRPGGAPLHYRGSGVLVSRASHRRRPITPAATVLLALVAAAITLWLGLVAQAGGVVGPQAEVPGRLAVVQVHNGESLQQVARRVAPHAPVTDVVAEIRELNQLETVALTAGQTLIAPVA
ncbi:LysM peptidoglycan-binding domain-containing protein [Mycolicibacterium sp. 3033]|nr:LysM peptidoglycan-binding domain-containing protein [Mycolicibacterium aurantiacum]